MFNETFDILTNNTLSRAELNYENGEYKNIHYGDVLIKFPAHIDTSSPDVPYINDENASKKFDSALLHNGDIVLQTRQKITPWERRRKSKLLPSVKLYPAYILFLVVLK